MRNDKRKVTLTILYWLCITFAFGQQYSDSTNIRLPLLTDQTDTLMNMSGSGIEIFKLATNRIFRISKTQTLRVYCYHTDKGYRKLKSANILDIAGHEITFKPVNKHFQEIAYVDSDITYLEITTAGSVMGGIIINAVLISAVVVTVAVIIAVAVYAVIYGGSSLGGGTGNGFAQLISILPWNNFHKHIKVYNRHGIQKWGVRTI